MTKPDTHKNRDPDAECDCGYTGKDVYDYLIQHAPHLAHHLAHERVCWNMFLNEERRKRLDHG